MITLNLLSPNQKKELQKKRLYLAVRELLMLFLLFTSITGILLINSRHLLEKQLTDLIERNIMAIQTSRQINEEVIIINKKINYIYKLQQGFRKWSPLLEQLPQFTPDRVSYNLIKIDPKNNSLELQGIASTREDLLALKQKLVESNKFSNVELPLSSLLNKENNVFNLQLKLAAATSTQTNALPKK